MEVIHLFDLIFIDKTLSPFETDLVYNYFDMKGKYTKYLKTRNGLRCAVFAGQTTILKIMDVISIPVLELYALFLWGVGGTETWNICWKDTVYIFPIF